MWETTLGRSHQRDCFWELPLGHPYPKGVHFEWKLDIGGTFQKYLDSHVGHIASHWLLASTASLRICKSFCFTLHPLLAMAQGKSILSTRILCFGWPHEKFTCQPLCFFFECPESDLRQNRSKYIDSIESIDWEQQYYGNCLKRITIKIQQKIRVPKCGTIKSFRQRFVVIDRTREIIFHLGIPQLVASYVLCPYISESIQRLDIWCCSFERFKPTRGVRSMSNEGSHPKFLGAVGPIFFII